MGSAFGCTNISCFKNTTKDIRIDIFKKNNLDNLYTVNSTGKNEKEIQEEKEELDEIKEINNEKDYIEKEEIKENIQEENQNISNS